MMNASIARHAAEELAKLAEKIRDKIPEKEDWFDVRRFLSDTTSLLRQGDVKAGMRAFHRVLPYVQHAFSNVDKYSKVVDTYELTETLKEHFLVDTSSRDHVDKVLLNVKAKMATLKESIEVFGQELDTLLEAIINKGEQVGLWTSVKLAFHMNRISALVATCEDGLQKARGLIDQIDTHVAGKSLLATMLAYVAFVGSIFFSASGNIPVATACLATATASRKSAANLSEYRAQLADIDRGHQKLQTELAEWRFRFRAEQRNFLLIIGIKYAVLLLIVLGLAFVILGKAANFLFFSSVSVYLLVKSEETNHMRYYAALMVGVLAMVVEWQKATGLLFFNTGAAVFLICKFLGFMEII